MIRKFQGKDYLSLEDVRLYYDPETKTVVMDVRDPHIPGGVTLSVPTLSSNELKLLRVLHQAGLNSGDYGTEDDQETSQETTAVPQVEYRHIILGERSNGDPLRIKMQTASQAGMTTNGNLKPNVFIVEGKDMERSHLFDAILRQVANAPQEFRATVYAPHRPDLDIYRQAGNIMFLQNEFDLLMFLRSSYEIPLGRGSIVNMLLIDEFNALVNPVYTVRHINERTSSTLRMEILSHLRELENRSEKLGFYCILSSVEISDDHMEFIQKAGTRLIMSRLDQNISHPLSEKLDIYLEWPIKEDSQTGYVLQNGTEGFFFTEPTLENEKEDS